MAITGEITLKGDVNAIGGLYEKINGGIKAGIKHSLFQNKMKEIKRCCRKIPK